MLVRTRTAAIQQNPARAVIPRPSVARVSHKRAFSSRQNQRTWRINSGPKLRPAFTSIYTPICVSAKTQQQIISPNSRTFTLSSTLRSRHNTKRALNSPNTYDLTSGPTVHQVMAVSTAAGNFYLRNLQIRIQRDTGLEAIVPPASQRARVLYLIVDQNNQSKVPMAPAFAVNNSSVPKAYFWFEDGTIVCWGCNEEDFKSVIAFTGGLTSQRSYEQMAYQYSNYGGYDVSTNMIHLSPEDQVGEMLAFSHGIARSVKLDALEAVAERAVGDLGQINEFFLSGGKISWFRPQFTEEELNKKIGKIMKLRWDLNVKTDIGEPPEYLWEAHPKHERLYERIERALDIKNRLAAINKKLKIADDDLAILGNYLTTSKGNSMEKMIVYLLIVEVASLILEKWGVWHNFRWEWFFGELLNLNFKSLFSEPSATDLINAAVDSKVDEVVAAATKDTASQR